MKILFKAFIICFLFSCQNEKIIQLPEITYADTNEVLDVSPAYIFYDETKTDSVELNRKNLISTTNWLVNVDKRLTLEQAIPKIKFLQDKKRNAEIHKNEAAKNYFTCNDISIKNLGFIEFTDIIYHFNEEKKGNNYFSKVWEKNFIKIHFNSSEDIAFFGMMVDELLLTSNSKSIITDIENHSKNTHVNFVLNFNKDLLFQEYISFKSLISLAKQENITIDDNEFIY